MDVGEIGTGNTSPRLVVDDMPGPTGVAVTGDNTYLIVANMGNSTAWDPYWNVYAVDDGDSTYTLETKIDFSLDFMGDAPINGGLEIFDESTVLAVCPGGICLINLNTFELAGRITIETLVTDITVQDNFLYCTSSDNLFRIPLTSTYLSMNSTADEMDNVNNLSPHFCLLFISFLLFLTNY